MIKYFNNFQNNIKLPTVQDNLYENQNIQINVQV